MEVFITLGIIIWSFISLPTQANKSWLLDVNALLLALVVAFITMLYSIHYREMMHKFREIGSSQPTLTASESTFTLSSSIGSRTFQWSVIIEIWKFLKF